MKFYENIAECVLLDMGITPNTEILQQIFNYCKEEYINDGWDKTQMETATDFIDEPCIYRAVKKYLTK